jgi:hypothetical protein
MFALVCEPEWTLALEMMLVQGLELVLALGYGLLLMFVRVYDLNWFCSL